MEFMRDYPDDAACLEHLWRSRYSADGEHADCPKCGHERVFRKYQTAQGRQSWTCTGYGHHVHPTAGTIFHKSSTSLHLWFFAIYMMTSTRCGVSAKMLEREIGVSYKTAWRMLNKIRNELMVDDGEPLRGDVEVDEASVDGKPRKPGQRYLACHRRGARKPRSSANVVEQRSSLPWNAVVGSRLPSCRPGADHAQEASHRVGRARVDHHHRRVARRTTA